MPQLIALLSSALPLQADKARVHLVPAGEFAGVDGRPAPGRKWSLNDVQGVALASRLTQRHGSGAAFQFDYEHQTFLAEENGQPAPSAGWGRTFEWVAGEGLFVVDVNWTKRANEFIDGDEYRYISPAIVYDPKTFVVTGLVNASLVGTPNLNELAPLAQAVARLSANYSLDPLENDSMNPVLKALLAALGLADTATETEAVTALNAIRMKADQVVALNSQIATLKTATPDPAAYVPMDRFTGVSSELATLKAKVAGDEVDALIAQANAEGKVASTEVEVVWRDVGKRDVATLKALIDKTPANPALAGKRQTQGKAPEGGGGQGGQLSADEVAICKQMGISAEDYSKSDLTAAA